MGPSKPISAISSDLSNDCDYNDCKGDVDVEGMGMGSSDLGSMKLQQARFGASDAESASLYRHGGRTKIRDL